VSVWNRLAVEATEVDARQLGTPSYDKL
jgi:hypothetical protein